MAEKFAGELYIGNVNPPQLSEFKNLDDENTGSFELIVADEESINNTIYERAIFRYIDPTSPPHTKSECGKWVRPWGGAKICVGWTIRYRWLYRIGIIRVETIDETDVKNILEECLKQSAIMALVAGIVSGGAAALTAAEIALKACLAVKIGEKFLSVSVTIKTDRGDWE